ncbi:MAG: MFS transporter [Clostridia bacterium]|nr:MFS transporter [Clostridia bacterium]
MKLNYKRTFLIGLAFMSISAFWTFYDQCIPYILKYTFGKEEVTANSIMAIDHVLALFLLPIFGMLSDKTHSRFGRRTPYVALGTVVFFVTMAFGLSLKSFWLFFAGLFLLLVAMGTYRSPAVSLMPDLTPHPLRSKANAVINLMGTAGGAVSLVFTMFLIKSSSTAEEGTIYEADQNYWPVMLAVMLFMALGILIFLFTVKERQWRDELVSRGELDAVEPKKEEEGKGQKMERPVFRSLLFILLSVAFWYMAYNGVTTSLSRYCKEMLGKGLNESSGFTLVAMVVAAVAFVPIGFLSSRFGRKKTILFGVGLMLAAFVLASFLQFGVLTDLLLYVIFSAVGIGWAAINVNSYPMVVEMSRGADVGKYTGYYYTFSMAAQVFTPVLSGFFISEKYLNLGYGALFPYAGVFMVAALVCMLFVKHGDTKAEKQSILESLGAETD